MLATSVNAELAKARTILIAHGFDPNDRPSWKTGYSAARLGKTELLSAFLDLGWGANERDAAGKPPLIYAVEGNAPASIGLLLDRGADPDVTDVDGDTPLQTAANCKHAEIIRYLNERGAVLDRTNRLGWTPLAFAISKNHWEVAEILVELGAKLDFGRFNLFFARTVPDPLFEKLAAISDVNVERADQEPLLNLFAAFGETTKCKLLIAAGAKIQRSPNGYTPWLSAMRFGKHETAEALCGLGDAKESLAVVDLFQAASRKGESVRVLDLLARGVDPNARDFGGNTALHYAAMQNDTELVRALLAQGADPTHHNVSNESALSFACSQKETDAAVELLLSAGSPVNTHIRVNAPVEAAEAAEKGSSLPLIYAARLGRTGIVQQLLAAAPNANCDGCLVESPLYAAAVRGHDAIVKALCEHGALVNHPGESLGLNPLFGAIKNRRLECVRLLLNAKADPNHMLKNGLTPCAALLDGLDFDVQKLVPLTEILLTFGADLSHERFANWTFSGPTPSVYDGLRSQVAAAADVARDFTLRKSERTGFFYRCAIDLPLEQFVACSNEDPTFGQVPENMVIKSFDSPDQSLFVHLLTDERLRNLEDRDQVLSRAAEKGNLPIVERLLSIATELAWQLDLGRALTQAAHGAHLEIAKRLFDAGALANPIPAGFTPLMAAVQKGSAPFTEFLLDHGANPTILNNQGETAVDIAQKRAKALLPLLLERAPVDLKDPKGRTPLYHASAGGNAAEIKVLLERGADANITDYCGLSALERAANRRASASALNVAFVPLTPKAIQIPQSFEILYSGDYDVADAGNLRDKLGSLTDADDHGNTMLHVAAALNDSALAAWLIENGQQATVKNQLGEVPWSYSTGTGATAELLEKAAGRLELLYYPNALVRRHDRAEALRRALDAGDLSELDRLIDSGEAQYVAGGIFLFHLACQRRDIELIELLLAKGVSVNCMAANGKSACERILRFFVPEDDSETLRLLLNSGASLAKFGSSKRDSLVEPQTLADGAHFSAWPVLYAHGIMLSHPHNTLSTLIAEFENGGLATAEYDQIKSFFREHHRGVGITGLEESVVGSQTNSAEANDFGPFADGFASDTDDDSTDWPDTWSPSDIDQSQNLSMVNSFLHAHFDCQESSWIRPVFELTRVTPAATDATAIDRLFGIPLQIDESRWPKDRNGQKMTHVISLKVSERMTYSAASDRPSPVVGFSVFAEVLEQSVQAFGPDEGKTVVVPIYEEDQMQVENGNVKITAEHLANPGFALAVQKHGEIRVRQNLDRASIAYHSGDGNPLEREGPWNAVHTMCKRLFRDIFDREEQNTSYLGGFHACPSLLEVPEWEPAYGPFLLRLAGRLVDASTKQGPNVAPLVLGDMYLFVYGNDGWEEQ